MFIFTYKIRKINRFLDEDNLEFGDYLLFQKYERDKYIDNHYTYKISKPIIAIYLGSFIADQAIGFNYVRWNNDRHSELISNEYVKNYRVCTEVKGIESHIEWDDEIDILGHWKNKPKWKEIIKSYRKQNLKEIMSANEIEYIK